MESAKRSPSCTPGSSYTQHPLLTSQFTLLTHSRMQSTCDIIHEGIIYIQDSACLEPSEGKVKSTSHIISETHFFHCFLLLSGILHLFHSFSKTFSQ